MKSYNVVSYSFLYLLNLFNCVFSITTHIYYRVVNLVGARVRIPICKEQANRWVSYSSFWVSNCPGSINNGDSTKAEEDNH